MTSKEQKYQQRHGRKHKNKGEFTENQIENEENREKSSKSKKNKNQVQNDEDGGAEA